MRRAVKAFVVAALIALPFGAMAPAANAAQQCDTVGPVTICRDGMGDIEIPGVVRICIRIGSFCGS